MAGSQSTTYEYLLINLALAWIPVAFSTLFVWLTSPKRIQRKSSIALCFFFWLIFFPNSPYLVTDIVHLQPQNGTILWFDVLLLESFSISGFFLTFVSLFQIQKVFTKWIGRTNTIYVSVALLYITSVGVSIGRFWRLNSWDVANPLRVLRVVSMNIASPEKILEILSFSTFFFFLLITIYMFLAVLEDKKSLS